MALAHGTGIGWVLAGLPLLPALLLLLLALAPLLPWFRPGGPNGTGAPRLRGSRSGTPRGVLALAAAAGLLAAFTSLLWDMTNLRAARANRAAAASYEDTRAPCRALLDAISGGSVRSLGSLDPKSVGRVCGEEDFFRAANSSASRLNTLPTGHP